MLKADQVYESTLKVQDKLMLKVIKETEAKILEEKDRGLFGCEFGDYRLDRERREKLMNHFAARGFWFQENDLSEYGRGTYIRWDPKPLTFWERLVGRNYVERDHSYCKPGCKIA